MHCPSLNIFGAFFPAWMLCALLGIVAAIIVYKLLTVRRLVADVSPALLFYPSIALSVTSILWLSLYGH